MPKINLEFKDIVTLLIAIYGAILSTVVFFRSWKKERRTLLLFFESDPSTNLFILRAVNVGFRPITLVDSGLEIYIRMGLFWHHLDTYKAKENLPTTLTDSKPETWILEQVPISRRVQIESSHNPKWKIIGYVRDSAGTVYKNSKPKRYDYLTDYYNIIE